MESLKKPTLPIYQRGEFKRSKVLAPDHKIWMDVLNHLQQLGPITTFESMIFQKDQWLNQLLQLEHIVAQSEVELIHLNSKIRASQNIKRKRTLILQKQLKKQDTTAQKEDRLTLFTDNQKLFQSRLRTTGKSLSNKKQEQEESKEII